MAKKSHTKMEMIVLQKHLGQEPAEGSVIDTELQIIRAFNYYNEMFNRNEAQDFLVAYAGDLLENKIVSKASMTMGWIARMLSRNVTLPQKTQDWFLTQIDLLPNVENKADDELVSVKETQSEAVISSIEESLDKDYSSEKIISILQSMGANKVSLSKVVTFYTPILDELKAINTSEDLKEAYRKMSKKDIKRHIERLEILLIFAKNGARRVRKVKAVKTPPAAPKVNSDRTLMVIVNDNNNEVKVIVGEKLSMTGKKVQNYDMKKSAAKRVRDLPAFEQEVRAARTEAKILEVLSKAMGKEFTPNTAVINKYCRIVKEI